MAEGEERKQEAVQERTAISVNVALGDRTLEEYLARFMLPTLLGNVIGGVALVAALNHAQVTAGRDNL